MRRLSVFLCTLICLFGFPGCAGEAVHPAILSEFVTHTDEELKDNLIGLARDEVRRLWGGPDGVYSGLRGDMWLLELAKQDVLMLSLFYDDNWCVERITINGRDL